MNENQHKAVRLAALLEEDDAIPTTTKPNGKANGHGKVCEWCHKRPQTHGDMCDVCWTYQETGVKPTTQPSELSTPDLCNKCHKEPRRPDVPFCATCFKKFTPDAKRSWLRQSKPQCQKCGKNPVVDQDNGKECRECIMHAPTKVVKQVSLEFPTECMYGWVGEYASQLGAPPSAAYPAALAVAAGYGVPDYRTVRSTLYVTILGQSRAGKSAVVDRAVDSWMKPNEIFVKGGYPGSEIGLVQILGGKRVKGDEHDLTTRTYLLVQDEMRNTFGKAAIQGSSLPFMLNQMFYKDVFETAAKGGFWVCDARLSILGCMTCANSDEFAEVYGVDTATGLYGRTIFGLMPSGYDLNFDGWVAPSDPGEDSMGKVWRRSKTCTIPAEVFQIANDWAKDQPERLVLKELALRVALVTSSLNHDPEVTQESIRKALLFMEWQQRIRSKYRPSEMDSPSGKCQQAIIRALEHYDDWVSWRDLCRNHSLYGNKSWDARILNATKKAMVFEEMIEEERYSKDSGRDTKEKTGRVRLVR